MAEVLKLGIVDDHKLFRKGLITLIDLAYPKCEILFEADNGLDLQHKLLKKNLPEIIIMDVNMPGMDGFASAQWLKENYPEIKVLVVSMVEKEETIVRMLKLGVKGYLSKDVEPQELGEALRSIMNRGFYYTDYLTGKLVMSIQSEGSGKQKKLATCRKLMIGRNCFLNLLVVNSPIMKLQIRCSSVPRPSMVTEIPCLKN